MMYLILKWLHVVAAIIAVGANATYGVWIARASRTPVMLPFTLRSIKFIDDRIASPCYGALLLTGLAMAYVVGFSLLTSWVLTSLVIYAAMALVAAFGYTPALKRQIEVLDRDGFDSAAYKEAAARGTSIGIVLAVMSMIIVFLMVIKPRLW